MREELTETVYAWVRDDCGVGLKMLLTRKETDALINRITAWNTRAKPPQGGVGAGSGLAAADDNREALVEAAKRLVEPDAFRIVSGSIGPLFDAGFSSAGQMVKEVLESALAAFQSRQEEK